MAACVPVLRRGESAQEGVKAPRSSCPAKPVPSLRDISVGIKRIPLSRWGGGGWLLRGPGGGAGIAFSPPGPFTALGKGTYSALRAEYTFAAEVKGIFKLRHVTPSRRSGDATAKWNTAFQLKKGANQLLRSLQRGQAMRGRLIGGRKTSREPIPPGLHPYTECAERAGTCAEGAAFGPAPLRACHADRRSSGPRARECLTRSQPRFFDDLGSSPRRGCHWINNPHRSAHSRCTGVFRHRRQDRQLACRSRGLFISLANAKKPRRCGEFRLWAGALCEPVVIASNDPGFQRCQSGSSLCTSKEMAAPSSRLLEKSERRIWTPPNSG